MVSVYVPCFDAVSVNADEVHAAPEVVQLWLVGVTVSRLDEVDAEMVKLAAKLGDGVTVTVTWPLLLRRKLTLPGVVLTLKSMPVPLRPTVCGLPGALSLTARVAAREPVAVGAKATPTVQLVPGASDRPLQR